LAAICEQLNNVNPFYASIKKSSNKVCGKSIVHCVNDEEIITPLQNIYCQIKIPKMAMERSDSVSILINTISQDISNSINKHKETMTKNLWQSDNKTSIYSIPHLTINATVIKNDSKISSNLIQKMLDKIEEKSNTQPNMILSSYSQRRAYLSYLECNRMNFDYISLSGNYKALSFNGIPFVVEKFLDINKIFFINTQDFELQQLCDWQWLEDDCGRILKRQQNEPYYTATLIKYANLICTNPNAQGVLISESVEASENND
jgi:hypothetical protein